MLMFILMLATISRFELQSNVGKSWNGHDYPILIRLSPINYFPFGIGPSVRLL
jgi:hypothetical protein